jgi:anhydro-N-acetylmuramic acid kinase
MDLWISQQRNQAFDAGGAWAASGTIIPALLARLLGDPYFEKAPPKSTGRDLFHHDWLSAHLAAAQATQTLRPEDIQRTLCELTASTLASAIRRSAPDARAVFVCGGGAFNAFLMQRIQEVLDDRGVHAAVGTTEALGIAPMHVESLAFAWLARQFTQRRPGNLPAVTGARGPRILGALYPA